MLGGITESTWAAISVTVFSMEIGRWRVAQNDGLDPSGGPQVSE